LSKKFAEYLAKAGGVKGGFLHGWGAQGPRTGRTGERQK